MSHIGQPKSHSYTPNTAQKMIFPKPLTTFLMLSKCIGIDFHEKIPNQCVQNFLNGAHRPSTQKTAYFPLATLVVMTRGLSFTQTHSKTHDCTQGSSNICSPSLRHSQTTHALYRQGFCFSSSFEARRKRRCPQLPWSPVLLRGGPKICMSEKGVFWALRLYRGQIGTLRQEFGLSSNSLGFKQAQIWPKQAHFWQYSVFGYF